MSRVKVIHRENRLGAMLVQPGGITVEHALMKAHENLESIRGSALKAVDEQIARIEAAVHEAGAAPSPDQRETIYRLANEIHGVAGVFGLGQLGEAAFSLCDLVDHLGETGGWSTQAIAVHLSALRLFRHPDETLDGQAVLAGLHQVVERDGRPRS